jgi:hypothetical protein
MQIKKWNNLAKKLQDGYRVIYSDEESFGIYVDLDGGRQQNVSFILQGFGKRQFVHIDSIICDRKQADVNKLIELTVQLEIGGVSVVDNFITLHHSIAFETLDESISSFSSFDTLVYATVYLATKADEIQKLLKIKDDSY